MKVLRLIIRVLSVLSRTMAFCYNQFMKPFKAIILLSFFLILSGCQLLNQQSTNNNMPEEKKNVRPMAVAGSFYPNSVAELNQVIDGLLARSPKISQNIRAVVAPHAGYVYAGGVMGKVFGRVQGKKYATVWLLGPSHYLGFSGVALTNYTHFKTPLGEIKLAVDIIDQLSQEKNFKVLNQAHQQEHSLEVELPFLQKTLGEFNLAPMVLGGQTSFKEMTAIAATLRKYISEDDLIVISCDFIHYGENYGFAPFGQNYQEKVRAMDNQVVDYLLNYQTEELSDYLETTAITNDGGQVLPLLSELLKNSGARGELAAYDTSANVSGDTNNSVSYAGLVFSGKANPQNQINQLSNEEKDYLLKLARQSLNYYFDAGQFLSVDENAVPERLKNKQGVFVTLTKNGDLRGCIGYIEPVAAVYQSVIDNAVSAAINDSRFMPVIKSELKDLDIEISVLSVPQILDLPAEKRLTSLRPETDGVVLEEGNRRSTYLPQVWEELTDPEEFLASLCQKGGWAKTCWTKNEVKLYTYQADVFYE